MEKVPVISLNSGDKSIPAIGFGTAYQQSDLSKETVKESILQAILVGYRHFDTAILYGLSEVALGEAIADALHLGYITSRDQLFITSKLWSSYAYGEHVLTGLKKTLKNLGLEYLDLYLIHWPVCAKHGTYVFPFKKGETYPIDYPSVWEAMEECQNLGLTKSIGVSNFSTKKLETILATAKIPPAVNQVEMSPCWQQNKLRGYCNRKGIHITAYSPLGADGAFWGMRSVMDCETLKEIALAKGKSLPQVRRSTRIMFSPNKQSNDVSFVDLSDEGQNDGTIHAGIMNKPEKRPKDLLKGQIYKNGKRYASPAAFKVALEHERIARQKSGSK